MKVLASPAHRPDETRVSSGHGPVIPGFALVSAATMPASHRHRRCPARHKPGIQWTPAAGLFAGGEHHPSTCQAIDIDISLT